MCDLKADVAGGDAGVVVDEGQRCDASELVVGDGGVAARDQLIAALEDGDPFVRRKAAESLGSYPDAVAAAALVGFLEQSKQRNEWPGEVAAQKALQRIAGTSGLRTAAAWRRFADELRGGSE